MIIFFMVFGLVTGLFVITVSAFLYQIYKSTKKASDNE